MIDVVMMPKKKSFSTVIFEIQEPGFQTFLQSNKKPLERYIDKTLVKLRSYCISTSTSAVNGVLTNHREWIFLTYSLKQEFVNFLTPTTP